MAAISPQLNDMNATANRVSSLLLVERLSEIYRKFCTIMGALSGTTIAIMILSTTVDVTVRGIFKKPVPGVFELNEVLLVICVYMGLAWTQIKCGHIRVTLIFQYVSKRSTVILDIIALGITFVWVFLLGYQTCLGAIDSIRIWEFRWGSVQMPIWWAKSLVPLGCWMFNVQLLLDIWTDVERLRGRLPLDLLISREE